MRHLKETMTLTVLSILMSSAAIAHASDLCKNVKFKVTNKHNSGGTIELHQVKYFNKANGLWKTEGLAKDIDCNQGQTCTTGGETDTWKARTGQVPLHLSLQGYARKRQLVRLCGVHEIWTNPHATRTSTYGPKHRLDHLRHRLAPIRLEQLKPLCMQRKSRGYFR